MSWTLNRWAQLTTTSGNVLDERKATHRYRSMLLDVSQDVAVKFFFLEGRPGIELHRVSDIPKVQSGVEWAYAIVLTFSVMQG